MACRNCREYDHDNFTRAGRNPRDTQESRFIPGQVRGSTWRFCEEGLCLGAWQGCAE